MNIFTILAYNEAVFLNNEAVFLT